MLGHLHAEGREVEHLSSFDEVPLCLGQILPTVHTLRGMLDDDHIGRRHQLQRMPAMSDLASIGPLAAFSLRAGASRKSITRRWLVTILTIFARPLLQVRKPPLQRADLALQLGYLGRLPRILGA